MSVFIIGEPLGRRSPQTLETAGQLVPQLLHELVSLRYIRNRRIVAAPTKTSTWIDQANTFFQDAHRSDWRSSGLLYYYSFLNYAKALLVAKRCFTYKLLSTTSIYHGLKADPQSIDSLTDFEVHVYPPTHRGRQNVFSSLYETLVGKTWPAQNPIKITLSSVVGYCSDISSELGRLYSIDGRVARVQSMVRSERREAWFEMIVPSFASQDIERSLSSWPVSCIEATALSEEGKNAWLLGFQRQAISLREHTCVCGPKNPFTTASPAPVFNTIIRQATSLLADYAYPQAYNTPGSPTWLFVPEATIAGKRTAWHPILSDYLFAFALGSLLRYQPHLLSRGSKSAYLAYAWCNQSAVTALRYFLMFFTDPPLRMMTY